MQAEFPVEDAEPSAQKEQREVACPEQSERRALQNQGAELQAELAPA